MNNNKYLVIGILLVLFEYAVVFNTNFLLVNHLTINFSFLFTIWYCFKLKKESVKVDVKLLISVFTVGLVYGVLSLNFIPVYTVLYILIPLVIVPNLENVKRSFMNLSLLFLTMLLFNCFVYFNLAWLFEVKITEIFEHFINGPILTVVVNTFLAFWALQIKKGNANGSTVL